MMADMDARPQLCRPEAGPVRKWFRRILRAVAIVLFALALAFVAYVLWANYRGESEKQSVLGLLRQRQLPESIRAFHEQEKIADLRADGTHLFRAAFMLLTDSAPSHEGVPYVGDQPQPPLRSRLKPAQVDAIRAAVRDHEAFYSLIKQAAAAREFHYKLDFTSASHEIVPPELNQWMEAARWLALKSLHEQAAGDGEAAMAACEDISTLNLSFAREKYGLIGSIHWGSVSLLARSIEHTLSRTTPGEARLASLRAKLIAESKAFDRTQLLKGDIAVLADELVYVERSMARGHYYAEWYLAADPYADVRSLLKQSGDDSSLPAPLQRPPTGRIRWGWRASQLWLAVCPGAYKEWYARNLRTVVERYDELSQPTEVLARKARNPSEENSPQAIWSRQIRALLQAEATLNIAVTAVAVERYRIRHNRWPASLAEVDGALPDPFSGLPLRSRRTEDGFAIYSVGADLQQDDNTDESSVVGDPVFRLFDPDKRNTE